MLRKAREGGAAAVEFALILPVLLLLIGGIIDFGVLYYNQILMSNAARDGARLVAANPSSGGWSAAYIQDRITDSATPIAVGSTASVWNCGASGTTVTVTVTRTTPFAWTVLGFVPALPTPTPKGQATITCS